MIEQFLSVKSNALCTSHSPHCVGRDWRRRGRAGNNKIKTLKRQAYGFRDREFFKLKILAIHETKYALVG